MNRDKAIEYQAQLLQINETLQKLKEIDFNVSEIEKIILNIEKTTDKSIEETYLKYNNIESNTFLYDALETIYNKSIKRLSKINNNLITEYSEYYTIYSHYQELEIKSNQVTKDNVNDYIVEIQKLLTNIKKTTTVDYNIESNLVEKIYALAYKTLKLEIIYSENNQLLEYILKDEVDISFIKKHIQTDLESLDLTNKQSNKIYQKVNELNKAGFQNKNLINKELLQLLTYVNNEELISETKKLFLALYRNLEDCATVKENLSEDITATTTKITEIIASRKTNFSNKIKRKLLLAGNLALLSSTLFGSYYGLKQATSTKLYQTTTTTYNSATDKTESSSPENKKIMPDSLKIVEYTPWVSPGYFRNEYYRDIYTYDLSKLEINYDNLKDYLTKDLTDYFTKVETKTSTPSLTIDKITETAEKVSSQELYKDNIYIVTKTIQDQSSFERKINYFNILVLLIPLSTILIFCDRYIILKLSRNSYSLKELRQTKKQLKKELKDQKQQLLETKNSLENITTTYEDLKSQIFVKYSNLPPLLKEEKDIKQRIKRLSPDTKNKN